MAHVLNIRTILPEAGISQSIYLKCLCGRNENQEQQQILLNFKLLLAVEHFKICNFVLEVDSMVCNGMLNCAIYMWI